MLDVSLDYLHIPIKGADAATLTASMLAVSFTGKTGPFIPADRYTFDATRGEWPGVVEILVGPGSTVGALAAGTAQAYVRVTAPPTVAVIAAQPGPYISTT